MPKQTTYTIKYNPNNKDPNHYKNLPKRKRKTVLAKLKKSKTSTPKWHRFTNDIITLNNIGYHTIATAINAPRVYRIVTLNPDHTLSDEIGRRNAECYYLIDYYTHNHGIRQQLLTDLKKYIPVYETTPKTHEKTLTLNKPDRDLLKAAIQHFHRGK